MLAVFYPYSLTPTGMIVLLALYITTIAISLSPIGEWVISVFAGAKKSNVMIYKLS